MDLHWILVKQYFGNLLKNAFETGAFETDFFCTNRAQCKTDVLLMLPVNAVALVALSKNITASFLHLYSLVFSAVNTSFTLAVYVACLFQMSPAEMRMRL